MLFHRSLLVIAAATGVLALASRAYANVDPDPEFGQTGSPLSVGFTLEQRCEGSLTLLLDVRQPDGVADAEPDPFDMRTRSIEPKTVSPTSTEPAATSSSAEPTSTSSASDEVDANKNSFAGTAVFIGVLTVIVGTAASLIVRSRRHRP